MVRENAHGEQTLVEGSFEQSCRIGGAYTTKLFVDLCRSRGLLPYRHRRQHLLPRRVVDGNAVQLFDGRLA